MTRAFWTLLSVAFLPVIAVADDGAVPWGNKFFVPKEPPPVIVHDFGTVPSGTILTHRFAIANIYAVPMQIVEDPRATCGCTRIVRYTKKLEPRESGFIDVEMDSRRFQGAKAVTITVNFGPQYRSTATLQVRAFARDDVAMTPGQINFGVVALGQQPSQTLDVQYSGKQNNWQITSVDDANAPNVQIAVQRLAPVRGSVGYRLTATLKADASPGLLQDSIVLKTNDPASPLLTAAVIGMVQSPLTVVQGAQVKLDPVQVGQESVRNIIIRANKPFKIVKVEGEGDGLTVKYDPVSVPIQRVTITFRPTQSGILQRKLTIHTDQKDVATVTIEGVAEGAAP